MSKFQPIPVFVKQGQIDQILNEWDERKNFFQEIVDRYKILNLTSPLHENDLVEMMNYPKEFIVKKITKANEFNLGGMKLDASKAFDLLEKPVGSVEFIEFIEASKRKEVPEKWFYRHAYFFVILDGLVEIKPDEIEKINNQQTVFLKCQKDKDIYDLLSTICNSINDLNKLQGVDHFPEKLFTKLLDINPNTGITSIKDEFLTIYN